MLPNLNFRNYNSRKKIKKFLVCLFVCFVLLIYIELKGCVSSSKSSAICHCQRLRVIINNMQLSQHSVQKQREKTKFFIFVFKVLSSSSKQILFVVFFICATNGFNWHKNLRLEFG